MALKTAPQHDLIANWKATGVLPYYTMWGYYNGYAGDSSLSAATWIANLEAHTGQPVEIIMKSISLTGSPSNLTTSLAGVQAHVYLEVSLCTSTGLSKTTDGTNNAAFNAIIDALIASGIPLDHVTIDLGWEAWLGGFNWAVGKFSQTVADYIAAYQHGVTVMRARGFTGTFMCDQTGGTVANIAAGTLWPGNSYADLYGYHCYNGISGSSSLRTNVPLWWTSDLKPRLDACTSFAEANNKLCGASEMGLQQAATTDTTSTTYNYHTQDTALYWPYIQAYMKANCRRWVGLTMFNQDQPGDVATTHTELNQICYFGTDPSTQPADAPHNTSYLGAVYDTINSQHALSSAAHVRSVMVPGSMQIDTSLRGGAAVATSNRPRVLAVQAL